jgi:Response regulator containing CheY-like receiver, AAA-type ATPase, and DNA-binding domains
MKPVALIIDDEVQIRRLLRVAFEAENYQVHEAENGQQGLVEVANYKPAVILLDLGLPDMDGLEVLKRLREWSEAPFLFCRCATTKRASRRARCRRRRLRDQAV